jgi:steroid delta-isomerase-like uncharacterized protein
MHTCKEAKQKGAYLMSTEQNKAQVRRLTEEVWNQGNFAVLDELFATDYVGHESSTTIQGQEGARQFISLYRSAFSDIHFTIEDMIAEGDKVVARWSVTGTHDGNLLGIPPTGKHTTGTGITIIRFVEGKDVEDWVNWDALGLMQQLGVVPMPGQETR